MKKIILSLCLCFSILFTLTACGNSNATDTKSKENKTEEKTSTSENTNEPLAQFTTPKVGEEIAVLETSMGTIKIRFFPEYAPKTVENFKTHISKKYYDGLIFHRVINDFMIQGGDPKGTGMGGESIWGKPFEDEFTPKLHNFRGALSMANAGPNTNGSQFFIVQAKKTPDQLINAMKNADKSSYGENVIKKYSEVGGTPTLDYKHTVFGQVIEGMDVVDKIASTKTVSNDKPEKDVKIKKAYLEPYKK
ncbi:peptidylprolyl isomerase [Clostridiaceae bacterium 14S0207]|nr:peptidylprolyl isomerase [Clostridiaceae bacterium 14S0207]